MVSRALLCGVAFYCLDFGIGYSGSVEAPAGFSASSVSSVSSGKSVNSSFSVDCVVDGSNVGGVRAHFVSVNGRLMSDEELWSLLSIDSKVYLLKVGHDSLPEARRREVIDFLAGDIAEHKFFSYYCSARAWLAGCFRKTPAGDARKNYGMLKEFFGGGK